MHETHGRLVAIMFIQVTEVTAQNRGAPVGIMLSPAHQILLHKHVKRYYGELVDVRTGEIFASFPGAELAFNAAVSLQQVLQKYNLRIGLHLGEVLFRQGRFQGAEVNFASRLPGCARAGGVCLSQKVYQYLPEDVQQTLVSLGPHALKNFKIGMPLYASLPAGQLWRSKRRELRRLLGVDLYRYRRYVLVFSMATVSGVFAWSQYPEPSKAQAPVFLYVPGIEQKSMQQYRDTMAASIEMNIRSHLSGSGKIHITETRAGAVFELLLSMDRSDKDIHLQYVLKSLPRGKTLATGYVEEPEQQLFHLQDRIAEVITAVLQQK